MKKPLFVCAITLQIVACGGNSDPVTPNNDPSNALVGTWADSSCSESTTVKQASTDAYAHQKRQWTMSKSGANTLSTKIETKYYGSADNDCTATVLNSDTRTGLSANLDGSTLSISYNGQMVSASRLKVTGPAVGGISAGGTIAINGLVYPGNYFTTAVSDDYYIYIYEPGKLKYTPAANPLFGRPCKTPPTRMNASFFGKFGAPNPPRIVILRVTF